MWFRKKNYKIQRYKKIPFETYKPEPRIELKKEQAVPFLFRFCNLFLVLGGMISFFVSSLLMSVKGIFGIREKIKSTSNFKVVKYNPKGLNK